MEGAFQFLTSMSKKKRYIVSIHHTGGSFCEPCCERCGDPTADYVVNPYLYDMYGEESYIWICDRCYKDIAGDI